MKWLKLSEVKPKITDKSNRGNHSHLAEYIQSDICIAFIPKDDIKFYVGRFIQCLRYSHSSNHEFWFTTDSGDFDLSEISHWQYLSAPNK